MELVNRSQDHKLEYINHDLNRRQKNEATGARQRMQVKDDNNKGREEQIGKKGIN